MLLAPYQLLHLQAIPLSLKGKWQGKFPSAAVAVCPSCPPWGWSRGCPPEQCWRAGGGGGSGRCRTLVVLRLLQRCRGGEVERLSGRLLRPRALLAPLGRGEGTFSREEQGVWSQRQDGNCVDRACGCSPVSLSWPKRRRCSERCCGSWGKSALSWSPPCSWSFGRELRAVGHPGAGEGGGAWLVARIS